MVRFSFLTHIADDIGKQALELVPLYAWSLNFRNGEILIPRPILRKSRAAH